MAQPDYVPVSYNDRVRQSEKMPPHAGWKPERPGDLPGLRHPEGSRLGVPGPDQGFGLKLARRFESRLEVTKGEHAADAVAGCLGVALKRAALYGRAPVIYDFELAYTLWGFLGGAPSDLVEFRKPLFAEASHHYWELRDIADLVPESTLRMTPADVRGRLSSWRELIQAQPAAS